jgi:hypothetical protein
MGGSKDAPRGELPSLFETALRALSSRPLPFAQGEGFGWVPPIEKDF